MVLVLSASLQKIVVDTYVIKIMIQSIRFFYLSYIEKKRQEGQELPKYFWHWKVFVWLAILLTIIESLTVVATWILYTPGLFFDSQTLKEEIRVLRIALRYFFIPIANTFRSCGAIILTIYLCQQDRSNHSKV